VRVARRNALDDGNGGLLELLADFWQNGFFITIPLLEGKAPFCELLEVPCVNSLLNFFFEESLLFQDSIHSV
jgi:hypothetical protein